MLIVFLLSQILSENIKRSSVSRRRAALHRGAIFARTLSIPSPIIQSGYANNCAREREARSAIAATARGIYRFSLVDRFAMSLDIACRIMR
jgi:hypothetical protein